VSAGSGSPGSRLGRRAIRALAARHGIRPRRAFGQNFLVDPNLARAIAASAGAGPGVRVLEVGAGLGSLTVALAEAGAEVLALELDRALLPALEEVCAPIPNVRVVAADALRVDWDELLGGGRWTMASNLPYNVAVPLLLDVLERVPAIRRYVVMVQREVGARLVARAGTEPYGAVSAKVAYLAEATLERSVPPAVFWPQPKVGSVLVALVPRDPPVPTPREVLFPLIDRAFAERRKTLANALRRMGLDAAGAAEVLGRAGLSSRVRAEDLSLEELARVAEALPADLLAEVEGG
jgi:16S rRNA (adenine1518-N6/adenine1519-N6)-dimethyltransferase